MNITDAVKKVRAEKPKENLMLLRLNYDTQLVLPFKDGLVILGALANAEKLCDNYGKQKRIVGVDKDAFSSTLLPYQEYEQIKISALLNISLDEVKEMMEVANKPPELTT